MFTYEIKNYNNYEVYLFYDDNNILTFNKVIDYLRLNYNNFIIFFSCKLFSL